MICTYYDGLVPSVAEVLPHFADNRRAGSVLLFPFGIGGDGSGWNSVGAVVCR